MSADTHRRRLWIALAAVGVGGVLLWWVLGDTGTPDTELVEDVTFGVGAIPEGSARDGEDSVGGRVPDMGPGAAPRERPEQLSGLEVYLRESVYPPTSRPLTHESHSDIIDWNLRAEYARPTQSDPTVTFLYSADRYFVIGSEQPVESFLDVRRGGTALRPRIVRATAEVRADRGPPLATAPQPIELAYTWNGERMEHSLDPAAFGRGGIAHAAEDVDRVRYAFERSGHGAIAGVEDRRAIGLRQRGLRPGCRASGQPQRGGCGQTGPECADGHFPSSLSF